MYLDVKEGKALKQVLGTQAGGHVSIDQCKIRGRREQIAFGDVSRVGDHVIISSQSFMSGPKCAATALTPVKVEEMKVHRCNLVAIDN
jgi:hypothetical protein